MGELENSGYCELSHEEKRQRDGMLLVHLVSGWIRETYGDRGIITEIIDTIVYYHRYDKKNYVEIKSGGQSPKLFLTAKVNIKLSKFLMAQLPAHCLEVANVPPDTLEHVLTYLAHHKGVEPQPIPKPIRSVKMERIVSDQWDATWIGAFDKKTIFEIILAAAAADGKQKPMMDIKSLVHLGCAKIATLIKGKSPEEIKVILSEENQYRREEAQPSTQTSNDEDANSDGDDDNVLIGPTSNDPN